MVAPQFPRGPSELTLQWLSSMLDSEITDFSVESIGADTGFAGSVYRVHLRW